MRTRRSILVGTVIAGLLSGPVGVTLAQEDASQPGVTEVTGTITDWQYMGGGEFEDRGRYYQRHGEITWPADWGDPRLGDSILVSWWRNEYPVPGDTRTPAVYWGTFTLPDEAGTWTGPFQGTHPLDGSYDLQATLRGDGAYAGLMAIINANWTGFSGWDLRGLIFEGEPPLLP